jgi:hypothetical protein
VWFVICSGLPRFCAMVCALAVSAWPRADGIHHTSATRAASLLLPHQPPPPRIYAFMRKSWPGAKLVSSTFEDFVDELVAAAPRLNLSVVTGGCAAALLVWFLKA